MIQMLNEIIFRGFKSFADEQVMRFEKGTNGIIGPNGCGKSNIIDGISFVLGAQSAKSLRGGKMQDVIFAGSSSRKAKDMAEVTLVLDNSEGTFKKAKGEQISVTRRVLRSGGSEYYIDGEPARLKDVNDLFMDTGVGSDSYSIIGQGQIGKILSTKLEERRAIFEEAAGIVKLKQQKEQTEKRLREVDGNMVRIEDIVKEIEKQLKPLEKQAEKALEFKELDDELQMLEVQYLLHEYDNLQEKITETDDEITVLSEQVEHVSAFLEDKEANITSFKETYQIKNDELFELQNQSSEVKEELEKIKGTVLLNDERIENAHNQIKEADENLREIEAKHSLSTEEFKNRQKRLTEILETVVSNEKEINRLNEDITQMDYDKLVMSNDIEHTRKKSIEEYNEINRKTYEMTQLEKAIEELTVQLADLSEKNSLMEEEKKALESEVTIQKDVYTEHLNVLKENETLYQSKQTEAKELKNDYTKNLTLLQETEREWIRLKNQVEHLENFIENNEGFYDGVKSVLSEKKKGRFDGIHGAVAEVIQVEKKFEVSVESLLQSSMQFLIVEDDKVAKDCITYLKNEKKGKATFLPLNLANPYSFDKKELNEIASYSGVRLAPDAISYNVHFAPVMQSLLGRSIIADNLDIGLSFLKEKKIRAKIATIDGEIVQSGSISGGQSKHQKASFFTKRRELEELKTLFDNTTKQLELQKTNDDTLKVQVTTYEQAIETLFSDIDNQRLSLHEKQKEYEDSLHQLERFTEKMQDTSISEQEVKMNLSESKKGVIKLKFSLEAAEKKYAEMNEELVRLENQLKDSEDALERLKEEKTNMFLSINRLNEEEKQIKSYLDDFNNDHDSVEEKIRKLYARKETEIIRISELEEHGEGLGKQLTALEEKMQEYNQKVDAMRASNQDLNKQIEEMENAIKTERQKKEELEKELNQKQVFFSRKETEKSNTLNRLKESYNLEEEQLETVDRREIDLSASKKKVSELKKKIATLGNINHTAVEEFANLSKRYKDEKEQLDDVKTAKADLRMLISNVENEMINRFTSSFDSIAKKFSETFVELFEGGKAKLTLEDPNEPLTSAIEIIAQPPGKKPASINSLSGGEKSFTAVALIFAIISSKPSPFVILDEVDAPLDDANVARFARQLIQYKGMSQFVVITHRKGTMMACDTITGITQEERGVSIVFPHTLEDKERLLSS